MNDLTKIALAALISVAAKELLTQLANWLKVWKVTRKFLQTLGGMIRSHSLFLYLDLALALFSGWQTYLAVVSPEPVSRGAIFAISFSTGLAFFWLREFFHDLRVYRAYIDEPPEVSDADGPGGAAPPSEADARSARPDGRLGQGTEAGPLSVDETLRAAKRVRRKRRDSPGAGDPR